MSDDVLDRLMLQLQQRCQNLPEGSYTTQLLRGGLEKMGGKILEEAAEVVEAAGEPGEAGEQHLVYEACDLLFHLWVLLASRGISLDTLRGELSRREGVSGIVEKQRRSGS